MRATTIRFSKRFIFCYLSNRYFRTAKTSTLNAGLYGLEQAKLRISSSKRTWTNTVSFPVSVRVNDVPLTSQVQEPMRPPRANPEASTALKPKNTPGSPATTILPSLMVSKLKVC